MVLCKLVAESPTAGEKICFSLRIDAELSWKLLLFGTPIPAASSPLLQALPPVLTSVAKLEQVVNCLESSTVCIGNNEEHFLALAKSRKGVFMSQSGK